MDPAKLKVVELRQELQKRGLDSKGIKSILVDRLRTQLELEGAQIRDQALGLPVDLTAGSDPADTEYDNEQQVSDDEAAAEHVRAQESFDEEPPQQQQRPAEFVQPPVDEPIAIDDSPPASVQEPIVSSRPPAVVESEEASVDDSLSENYTNSQAQYHFNETIPVDQISTQEAAQSLPGSMDEDSSSVVAPSAEDEDSIMASTAEEAPVPSVSATNDDSTTNAIDEKSEPPTDTDMNKEKIESAEGVAEKEPMDEQESGAGADVPAAAEGADAPEASADEKKVATEEESRKRKRSPSPKARTRTYSAAPNTDDFTNVEDEPAIDPEKVTLSWIDSDLHLRLTAPDFCDARPLSDSALGLVWAGARATHGVTTGQVFYEVKVGQKNGRVHFPEEKHPFVLRCGWSTQKAGLHLGEAINSFGYCSAQGQKVTGDVVEEYGVPFTVDDVVGVYLDLESEPCKIEFTLNGESQGTAFEFNKESLDGDALFPHVLTKNMAFSVNFGQMENNMLHDLKAKETPVVKEVVNDKVVVPTEGDKEATEQEAVSSGGDAEAGVEEVAPEKEESKEEQIEGGEEKVEAMVEDIVESSAGDGPPKVEENAEEEAAHEPKEEAEAPAESKVEEEVVVAVVKEINRDNLPGYTFICRLEDKSVLVCGPVRPESRKECEVIMMIGLPGGGKTTWARKWAEEHPEKKYHILGAASLIERMKNPNIGKKVECAGRRLRLSEMCSRGLNMLQEIAQKRRRNYILDQTNTLASAQRRKMKGFGDFRRMAVIVLPDEEEYAKRQEACKNDIDKDNSEQEMNEMKAHFTLPSLDLGWFDEIKYTDTDGEAASKLVDEYNVKGRKALPPPAKKRQNYDNYRNDNRRRDFNNQRDRYSRWGGNGGGPDRRMGGGGMYDNHHRDNRWGGGGGGPGGGPHHGHGGGGGGYRQPHRDYGYNNRRQDRWSGGGGGSGSGGGQNWTNNNNRRDFRGGRSDYGGGSGGGGGGGYNRSGGPPQHHRDQRSAYGSGRDHSSSGGHSHHRRHDGRDHQDFRERRDGGVSNNRRYDPSSRNSGTSSSNTGRNDYHKRDYSSSSKGYDASKSDMSSNGGVAQAANNWNAMATQQQQQQWGGWSQQQLADSWSQPQQGWAAATATHHQQQQWSSWGTAANMQHAGGSSASTGQWKSYGTATGSAAGQQPASASSGGVTAASQWDNQQQWGTGGGGGGF